MKEDKLDILLKEADDIPYWAFCRLFSIIQWNV
jgi:hypothetical protein